ncbi:NAD(P)H-quinone oxidoreductase [Azospirillum griseum]|nr:NAD(P)H-quinone oxidoreductase [Azospirillum griseum]
MPQTNHPDWMTQIVISAPGEPSVLRAQGAPVPTPAAGDVLVRVEAAGINRPDVLQRQGHYPMPPGVTPVPGLEIAGVVVAVGPGVDGWAPGDRVCGLTNGGGYAEFCLVPAGQLLPIPRGFDAVQAAALPETFFTVWANLFGLGRARAGDRVLIHGGSSGIGTTALLLCREFGIEAFATAGDEAKCDAIRALGGTAIQYRTTDFSETILQATDGRGVDVVLDIMGGSYFDRNLSVLARDGRLVVIGFMGGRYATSVDLQSLVLKRVVVTGSTMRSRSPEEKAEIARELRERVWPVLEAGRCLPVLDRVFPFLEAAEAHRHMESGAHVGKIVLRVSETPSPL